MPEAFLNIIFFHLLIEALRATKKINKKRLASQNLPIKNKRKLLGPGYARRASKNNNEKHASAFYCPSHMFDLINILPQFIKYK